MGVSLEKQNLSIGLFDEKTEDRVGLSATVGVHIGKKATVQAMYGQIVDNLNSTRNQSTLNVGVKVNL